jgi:hypothetical protein
MTPNYRIEAYYKQGDDLNCFLEMNNGDSKKALLAFANHLREIAENITLLVKEDFNRRTLKVVHSDTHLILITGDEKGCLSALENKRIKEDTDFGEEEENLSYDERKFEESDNKLYDNDRWFDGDLEEDNLITEEEDSKDLEEEELEDDEIYKPFTFEHDSEEDPFQLNFELEEEIIEVKTKKRKR